MPATISPGVVEADVDGQKGVDVVEVTALSDGFRATDDLFGGLEQHLQRPLEVALGDGFQHTDAEDGVGVVTAGVHRAGLRTEALVRGDVAAGGRLLARQAVDVDAQADGGPGSLSSTARMPVLPPRICSRDVGVGAGLTCAFVPLFEFVLVRNGKAVLWRVERRTDVLAVDADAVEFVEDSRGRVELAPGWLRVTVEVASERDESVETVVVHTRATTPVNLGSVVGGPGISRRMTGDQLPAWVRCSTSASTWIPSGYSLPATSRAKSSYPTISMVRV